MNGVLRTVCIGDVKISYVLMRKNIKNIHLRVGADCTVTLSGPMRLPAAVADDFVIKNADFVLKNTARRAEKRKTDNSLLTFAEGETVTVFGVSYRLKAERGRAFIRIEGEDIIFSTPNGLAEERAALFLKYEKQECKRVFSALLARYYPYFKRYVGETPPSLTIRSMRSVWGTCCAARNKITLNSRLFSKPMPAVEYVVVHEYCHFIYQNHSPAFYAEVEKILPDWRARKKLLS